MDNQSWQETCHYTHLREALVGAGLARLLNASLHFNQSPERRHGWDYLLFSPSRGSARKVEQQCDFTINDEAGTLFFELFTHGRAGKKPGKLFYTQASRFAYVAVSLEKVFFLDVQAVRGLVVRLQESGALQTTTPASFGGWAQKHGSRPTTGALLPLDDLLIALPETQIFTFGQLGLPKNYESYRPANNRKNPNKCSPSESLAS